MRRTTRTTLGDSFNEGARLAWIALKRLGWSQTALTERMTGRGGAPLSGGQVDGWLYGDGLPGRASAEQLEALLDVPVSAWGRRPARRFVLPAVRHAEKMARSVTAR